MTKKNRFELDEERIATTDENGKRVVIHPEDVKGFWRTRRTYFFWALILIYLFLPWIYIDGKQWVLLDIPRREFTLFGTTFFGHDAPLIIFFFAAAGLFFGFITSLWGRVWCGWACPQTVFIDAIFRKIESIVEGNSRKRITLDAAPMSFSKFMKRSVKWGLFIIASLHIAHSFIGYFVGTHKLFYITMSAPSEHFTVFFITMFVAAIVLFDFAFFREQFCLIACPYGRFQSVIMDDNSKTINYDKKRGEPRRSNGVLKEDEGDCINCYHCVKVCPTGIDIRRGTQLECIACTMCIDACDSIMDKISKPKGLISYISENELKGEKHTIFSIRNIIYAVGIVIAIVGMTIALLNRSNLDVNMIRGNKSPFQVIQKSDGSKLVVNHWKMILNYQGEKKYQLFFVLEDKRLQAELEIVTPMVPYPMKKGSKKANLFFRFKPSFLIHGSRKILVTIKNGKTLETAKAIDRIEVRLVGPL